MRVAPSVLGLTGVVACLSYAACTSADPGLRRPGASSGGVDSMVTAYQRRDWRHWIDADRDCQNARQEVLIAESEVPVEFAGDRHCKVKRGRWTCPYTGRVVTDPAELDVDHLVPLENAHRSGGWRWEPKQKSAFANDLEHPEALVAVVASANREKGSKGPNAWLPPNVTFRCKYITNWVAIKTRWALAITPEELAAIGREEKACARPVRPSVAEH